MTETLLSCAYAKVRTDFGGKNNNKKQNKKTENSIFGS